MLTLHRPLLDEIALGAAVVAVVALLVAIAAHLRLRRLRRGFASLEGPEGPQTVLEAIGRSHQELAALRAEVAAARAEVGTARSELADALRHVAVVRYDAFSEMGGRLSFTVALLDDTGDGLVLTSINGRTEGRSYAKGVRGGVSEHDLSPEETEAIKLALGRQKA